MQAWRQWEQIKEPLHRAQVLGIQPFPTERASAKQKQGRSIKHKLAPLLITVVEQFREGSRGNAVAITATNKNKGQLYRAGVEPNKRAILGRLMAKPSADTEEPAPQPAAHQHRHKREPIQTLLKPTDVVQVVSC